MKDPGQDPNKQHLKVLPGNNLEAEQAEQDTITLCSPDPARLSTILSALNNARSQLQLAQSILSGAERQVIEHLTIILRCRGIQGEYEFTDIKESGEFTAKRVHPPEAKK